MPLGSASSADSARAPAASLTPSANGHKSVLELGRLLCARHRVRVARTDELGQHAGDDVGSQAQPAGHLLRLKYLSQQHADPEAYLIVEHDA